MELYRKYRETSLDGIKGNANIIATLRAIVAKDDRPHTFLFCGPAGCGKTTLAYILASEFGIHKDSLTERNSADYRGIDSVREFAGELEFMPFNGTRGYIFEEAHRLTQEAQEALLKPVENCPENTYLFFTTTDPSKVNAALKTRMVIIPVEPIGDDDLSDLVHSVAKKENIDLDDKVVEHIVASAYSSPRRALTMLEKVIGLPLEEQLQVAGYADEVDSVAIDLCRALSKRAQWSVITEILDKMTVEPEAVRRSVLGYMRKVLLKRDNPRAYLVMTAFAKNYYDSGNAGLIMSCYEARMAE